MNTENITIEQKKVILAGLLSLNREMPIVEISKIRSLNDSIKDFLLIVDKLRFFSLDMELGDLYYTDIMDLDVNDTTNCEYINFLFEDLNCNDFINFHDILNIASLTIHAVVHDIADQQSKEALWRDVTTIDQMTIEDIIKKIKFREIDLAALCRDSLFKTLVYLEANRCNKVKRLKKIEISNLNREKEDLKRRRRSRNLLRFLLSKDPISLLDFINKGRKHCINTLVECDYAFCKQENITIYRKELEYLKFANKGNLSRSATGREILNWLTNLMIVYFTDSFYNNRYNEEELDKLNNELPKTWLWKYSKEKTVKRIKEQNKEL